jgi:hypothetical protein
MNPVKGLGSAMGRAVGFSMFQFKNSIGPERIEQPEPGSHPPCFVDPSGEGDTAARTDHGGRWPQIGFVERVEGDFVWVSMVNPVMMVPAFPAAAKHPGPWRQRENDSYSIEDANGRIIIDEFHVPTFDEATDETGETQEIERLVLAAPELLETLKTVLNMDDTWDNDPRIPEARALIARIEKGPNA